MSDTIRTIERDGAVYELLTVKTDSKCVGLAPAMRFESLLEMSNVLDEDTVLALAVRQYRTDAQNKVRAKLNKDKITFSDITKAIADGRLTSEMMTEANQMWQQPGGPKDFTEAAAKLLGLGKAATPTADTIHWDIL